MLNTKEMEEGGAGRGRKGKGYGGRGGETWSDREKQSEGWRRGGRDEGRGRWRKRR